ncbi:hypothetical protein HPB48_016850 [Haemaphysalis longicornis]|uniref:Uncharacterized protein n=1 Tax=Haemaphysalis longicornis TaxID=44386 RepID=A0A9J6FUJ4_HAELO|nr:hypothetical protein HPB48_016850 [Haemaphysalis longicornis]
MRLFFALGVTVMGILFVVAITLIVIAKGAPAVTTVVVKDDAVTLEPKQVANELGSILPPQRKAEASKAPPTEKERTMSPLRKDDEVTATTRPAVTTPRKFLVEHVGATKESRKQKQQRRKKVKQADYLPKAKMNQVAIS